MKWEQVGEDNYKCVEKDVVYIIYKSVIWNGWLVSILKRSYTVTPRATYVTLKAAKVGLKNLLNRLKEDY